MHQSFRLRFIAATIWLVLHGIEETLTGFAAVDNFYHAIFKPLLSLQIQESLFIFFQISLVCLFQKRAIWILFYILGVFLFTGLHHVIKVFIIREYYPGIVSARNRHFIERNLLEKKGFKSS